jgi:hypothetical protein
MLFDNMYVQYRCSVNTRNALPNSHKYIYIHTYISSMHAYIHTYNIHTHIYKYIHTFIHTSRE